MEKDYRVTKDQRKALVTKIAELTGDTAEYQGAPTFDYRVGDFTIGKTGILSWDEDADEQAEELMRGLAEAGFTAYGDEIAEKPDDEAEEVDEPQEAEDEDDREEEAENLTISLPDDLSEVAADNLIAIVNSKKTLLKHAFGAEDIDLEIDDGKITFPWFKAIDGDHTDAYTLFITKLVGMAKGAKRVTAKDHPVDNEKYAFRCFLLRIGMSGREYKGARKVLLENLTGSSAFKNGTRKTETTDNTETQNTEEREEISHE